MRWNSNEGKSRCYCAAVDCAPTPCHFLLTVSPKQDRCSVCMLPALPSSIFLPGIPDYCGICLIALSECLLFVRSDVLEGSAPSKMSLSATTRSVSSRHSILESAQKIYNSFLSCGYCNHRVKRVLVLFRGVVINKDLHFSVLNPREC